MSVGEVEGRLSVCESEVSIVEGADGTDIFPVAIKEVSLHAVVSDGHGEDVAAEVFVSCGFEEVNEEVAVEEVDAHGREVFSAA